MKKETRKEIGRYVLSSLTIMGISLLFSLLSLIFLIDKIPSWLKFAVSLIFIAPIVFVSFNQGKSQGEKLYKGLAKNSLSDIHAEQAVDIPMYKCIFHVLPYVVIMFALFIASVLAKSTQVRFVGLLFEFPIALLFYSVKGLNLQVVRPSCLAVFLPFTLIVAGCFVLGYVLSIIRLKRSYAEIKSELRSFDN